MVKDVGRKIFKEGGNKKKSIKYRKITLLSLFRWERATEKRTKNSKKYRKIALLSLYVLYLYHI